MCILLFLLQVSAVYAQPQGERSPDPKIAFLKSLAVPGWGHYYVDKSDWIRGKYQLGAEAVLIISYLGLDIHSGNLQQNWYGYARLEGGIDVEGRGRSLQLAVGDFNSLAEYNDFQLRSRNFDRLIEDTPENRWNWSGDAARADYNDIRSRFERIDQQLPALIGLMVVNRLVSAVSAYNRARDRYRSSSFETSFSFSPVYSTGRGISANLHIRF